MSVPKDPFSPEGRAVLIEQQKQAHALEEGQATLCEDVMDKEDLKHMGTTTTIWDMEEISKVLEGEDAPINFVGCQTRLLKSLILKPIVL